MDFRTGRTALFSCAADPRFGYALYVPQPVSGRRVLLAVHGTERDALGARDRFVGIAEETGTVVVAPLFPADIGGRPDVDGYKYLAHEGLRYDLVLNAILAEVSGRIGVEPAAAVAWGFSGGAQLVQRYALVHPDRVRAVALGAPGRVTWLEPRPWWQGVAGAGAIFGRDVDLRQVRQVPVHIAVGERDLDPLPTLAGETGSYTTRVARLRLLAEHLRSAGIDVRLTVVAGAGHEPEPLAVAATGFLRAALLAAATD